MLIRRRIAMLASLAGLTGATAASAAPGMVPGTEPHSGQAMRTTSNAHKLLSVVIDNGAPYSALPGYGFTTVDSTTVACSKPTCSIAVNISAQAGGQSNAGNLWAACAVVDGNYAPNGCPYAGELPTDESYETRSTGQTFDVTKGTHTVGFQIFVYYASTAGVYDVQYQVLTP